MKILILANSDVGLYKFRKELLEKLIVEGNRIFISLPDGEYISRLKKMGCIFFDTPVDRRGMNLFKDLRLLNRYYQLVCKVKPDVVLTYTIKPNIYGGIICRFCHVRYIETITGLGTAIENKGVLSKVLLILYNIALKNASQVFFQNRANKRCFEENKIISKGRLIPGSGVNLQEHCYEKYPKEEGNIYFLFVGRIMKEKGIGELLACAEQIGSRYTNVYFDLVGDYDEDNYKKEIAILEQKGIVRYFGQQEDIHFYLKTHHAVILPSYHEGISNVLLEAAACGRPILATRVPGCKETYDEGISGIGFEAKDKDSLIEAIEQFLMLTYDKRCEMGVKGRLKMEKEYDREFVIEAYRQELYTKI